MNTSRTTVWLIGLTLAGLVFAGAGSVRAQSDTNSGLAIDCEHFSANTNTSCQIDDFLNQFVVLSEYGLGLVGVLAVLMFVYGGFQYITAGGRASKVDEGTRVIQGTLIGIIISLIAYVIINFAVGAVTGTTSKGFSVFGRIATVFGNVNDKTLTKPFSGTPGTKNASGCRSTWDTSCSDQAFCADPGSGSGPVGTLQDKLNNLGCNCGASDGCFGSQTVTCVRNFQIANRLPPTGIVDPITSNAIGSSSSTTCTAAANLIAAASKLLPATSVSSSTGNLSAASKGCCLVKNNDGVAYCGKALNARACAGLNGAFTDGDVSCDQGDNRAVCGYCQDTSSNTCFQTVGQYWCQNAASPPFQPPTFVQSSSCNSAPGCAKCNSYLQLNIGGTLAP